MVFSFSNFISCVPFLIVFTISKWNHVILGFSRTSEKLSLQVGTWKRWYLGLIDLHVWLNFNSFYLKSLWSLGCPMIEVDCFSLNWIKPRWCWDSLCNLVNRWALYDARILPKTEVPKNILSHRRWPQLQVTHWNHLCYSLIEYILKTKMVLLKPKPLHAL